MTSASEASLLCSLRIGQQEKVLLMYRRLLLQLQRLDGRLSLTYTGIMKKESVVAYITALLLIRVVWGGVSLSPIGTSATNLPIVRAPDI
jgi:hypothetical protein